MNTNIILIITQVIIVASFAYTNYKLDKIEDILKDKNND